MSLAKTFIVVDSRHMSSFALSRSARGAVHIEPLDQLKATVTPRERGRPVALGNRGRAYGLMQLSAGTRDEDEDTRRFCREGAAWIKRAAAGIGKGETATRLTVFVPPRLLGILRAECGKLPASVVLKRIDLGGLSASALAKHRSVLAIAPGAKARAERVLA